MFSRSNSFSSERKSTAFLARVDSPLPPSMTSSSCINNQALNPPLLTNLAHKELTPKTPYGVAVGELHDLQPRSQASSPDMIQPGNEASYQLLPVTHGRQPTDSPPESCCTLSAPPPGTPPPPPLTVSHSPDPEAVSGTSDTAEMAGWFMILGIRPQGMADGVLMPS